MHRFGWLAACVLFTSLPSSGQEPQKPSYDALVAQARKGEAVDFTRMRIAFTETPAYNPIAIDENSNRMNEAYATLDHAAAAAAAEKVLAKKFVDLAAQRIASASYKELGQKERADFHQKMYAALLQSIRQSGTGQSADKAYVVIGADEEYELLEQTGYRANKQALVKEKDQYFDRLDAIQRASNKIEPIFFNVTIQFQALARLLKR